MQSIREIKSSVLALRNSGKLYDLKADYPNDSFATGFDRFSTIIYQLQGREVCLDVGPGMGLLPALLSEFGHQCHAVDYIDDYFKRFPGIYIDRGITFKLCNVEIDPIPYPDNFFDAVTCCQSLEHFTLAHLPTVREMRRVLKPGGILEIDVPNAVCFRNRWRMLRGKHITWDYKKHYLDEKPIIHGNMSLFPERHNREFVKQDLIDLFEAAGFRNIDVRHVKSRRYRTGLERFKGAGSALKDFVPSLRKTLMGFGEK